MRLELVCVNLSGGVRLTAVRQVPCCAALEGGGVFGGGGEWRA